MNQEQIEIIIRERIEELRRLEQSARHRSHETSYQDKRDELEALLLRIHGMAAATLLSRAAAADCH